MKQIYDFGRRTPPGLNEKMLRAELERRKLRLQTTLAVLGGFLLLIASVLLGYSAIDWYPALTLICFGYTIIAATAGGVIAVIYSHKGGRTA